MPKGCAERHFILTDEQMKKIEPMMKASRDTINMVLGAANVAIIADYTPDQYMRAAFFGEQLPDKNPRVCPDSLNCMPTMFRDLADIYEDIIMALNCKQEEAKIPPLTHE